jgi:hypothetical protein
MNMYYKIKGFLERYKARTATLLGLLILLTCGAWACIYRDRITPQPDSSSISNNFHTKYVGSTQPRNNPAQVEPEDEPSIPEFTGFVIDDSSEQFSQRGPTKYWHEEDRGYGDHSWWTLNNHSGIENVARWSLGITEAGTYEIFVYIPLTHSTTQKAVYTVSHDGEQDRISVNQNANRNSWHRLGDFSFAGTGDEYIELMDETGEADTKYEIAFDAVGYLKLDPTWEDEITGALWERVRPWLDEKFSTFEEAFKDWLNEQKGKLLQKMGDALKNWIDQQCAGLGAAMLLPLFAFVLWHKQRRKPPGPP